MQYHDVCLEAFAYTLPEEVIRSDQIEAWLEPTYRRLRLSEGRLELMTGIVERRFWAPGTLPSDKSVETAEKVIHLAGVDRGKIAAVIHGSVCRDFLEPATACGVHHRLGLPPHCTVYDVSNACLGIMNGIVQVANMIELGQIQAGLVVGTESSRSLVETTVKRLNRDPATTRNDVKLAMASLTIGSGSAAVLLVDRRISRTGNRLLGGFFRTQSDSCRLCLSTRDEAGGDEMQPLMTTDSEALMYEGVRAARSTFPQFLNAVRWDVAEIDKTLCHQVGRAHQKHLFHALGLDPSMDYPTIERLGNTGSVALPITGALGVENGHLHTNDRLALLGIGSGISVLMLAVDWQRSLVDEQRIPSPLGSQQASVPESVPNP
ncbi:MAG: 3-oxoacyl-ACP synthase III [Planctomycetota bacterium]|jgi:3-oxoacyl-[acyl-carrier-protein] synthase-3